MKSNCVQLLLICSTFTCIVSCKKSIDTSFATPEEPGKTNFPVGLALSEPKERPFKGRITGSFVSTPTSNPAIFNSVANASGNTTHLGVFNKVTSDVINVALSTVEGTFIITSQSGEQITGRYNGPFIFGATPGTFSWELNATITGGTGRFAYATGEFVFLANGEYVISEGNVIGDYTETFDGAIIY